LVDKGVASGGHPRVAPDEVGHAGAGGDHAGGLRRRGRDGGVECGEAAGDVLSEGISRVRGAGDLADGADHGQGVRQCLYVADPNGITFGEDFDLGPFILFLVCDDQIGFERVDADRVDGFGAADAGFFAKPALRTGTEAGDADDGFLQSKTVEQLCLRGYEGDDPFGNVRKGNGASKLVGKTGMPGV